MAGLHDLFFSAILSPVARPPTDIYPVFGHTECSRFLSTSAPLVNRHSRPIRTCTITITNIALCLLPHRLKHGSKCCFSCFSTGASLEKAAREKEESEEALMESQVVAEKKNWKYGFQTDERTLGRRSGYPQKLDQVIANTFFFWPLSCIIIFL